MADRSRCAGLQEMQDGILLLLATSSLQALWDGELEMPASAWHARLTLNILGCARRALPYFRVSLLGWRAASVHPYTHVIPDLALRCADFLRRMLCQNMCHTAIRYEHASQGMR